MGDDETRRGDDLQLAWEVADGEMVPVCGDHDIGWAPQPGGQLAALECPVFEVLIEGNRGGGKTDVLVMDFAKMIGVGWGPEWRGILFRQTYKQLDDVVAKTKKWFPRIWPAACYNESKMVWTWPRGETLKLAYMDNPDDYWNYHGHSYPWIGWEELTTWPDDKCYRSMMACSRSTQPGLPRKYISTTNPYGKGHNWVKARWHLPVPPGAVCGLVIRDGSDPPRVAIHVDLRENRVLLTADPDYLTRVSAAARNDAERKAWVEGSWDIVAGGMFDDLWTPAVHVLPNLPMSAIPAQWRIDRSYDHGQSRPFSVGWWAESNGEPLEFGGRKFGVVRGDIVRIAEWYGWNGTPNEGIRLLATEIADGIKEREELWGISGRVRPGPADSSIFDDYERGKSIAGDMQKCGVRWLAVDKGPGSRMQGWEQVRQRLKGSLPGAEGVREKPGLFVCQRCEQFIRTVPVLSRSSKDPDDVDTDAEDHIGDEMRYRCRARPHGISVRDW